MPSEMILDPDRRVPSPILKHMPTLLNKIESLGHLVYNVISPIRGLVAHPGKRNMLFAWLQWPICPFPETFRQLISI